MGRGKVLVVLELRPRYDIFNHFYHQHTNGLNLGPDPLILEACQIHARWSDARNVDVACFDMFEIVGSSQNSFFGNADDLAALLEPIIHDETRYQYVSPAGSMDS